MQNLQSELQKQKKARWMDISTAIILAIASVLSAWFSYQSGQWNSKQSFYLDDENIADNNRLQKELSGAQRRAGDGAFILNLITILVKNLLNSKTNSYWQLPRSYRMNLKIPMPI